MKTGPDRDQVVELVREGQHPPEPDTDALWERVQSARASGQRAAAPGGGGRVRRIALPAAAAITLVVVSATLAVPSVRTFAAEDVVAPVWTWTSERIAGLAEWLDPDPPARPGRLSIVPSGLLRVRIDSCQEDGRIEVLRHDTEDAVLEILAGDTGERLTARPDEFRVHNDVRSRASYRLRVPHHVNYLWLHIGRRVTVLPMRRGEPAGWVLYLQVPTANEIEHCRE